MKSSVTQSKHEMFNAAVKEIGGEKGMSKSAVLLVIVQTVFFNVYALLTSMPVSATLSGSIALAGLLITVFTFFKFLVILKWPLKNKEARMTAVSQLLLAFVFSLIWVFILL